MVRTRGLGRALDRVIWRALGRKDNCDSDDVPQRWRPTTFASMQRATAAVVGDARHVDDAAEEVFQHAKEAGVDAQDFPGGPHDTLVMAAYADHVVVIVLNGEVFIVFNKLYFNKYLLLLLKLLKLFKFF